MSLVLLAIILILLFFLVTGYLHFSNQLGGEKHLQADMMANLNDNVGQLFEYKKRYEILFDQALNACALINLEGRILEANHHFGQLFGFSKTEILAANFYYLVHPMDINKLQINIQNLLDKKISHYKSEEQCFKKNGEVFYILMTLSILRNQEERPLYFIAQVQDITWQKQAASQLKQNVFYDPLTSLANQNKLEPFIQYMQSHAVRHQESFTVMVLDIDGFKNVNESIGTEAADTLLQIIAERLRTNIRVTDMVARIGGDEFIIVTPDIKKPESAAYIAQKILDDVFKPVLINGHEVYTTASIGISAFPDDARDFQTLLKHADSALYMAKEKGGNQYEFYF